MILIRSMIVVRMAVVVAIVAGTAHAQFTFTEIARTGDIAPVVGGTFGTFFGVPAIDGDRVAFSARNNLSTTGIFTAIVGGPVMHVVDGSTTVPGEAFTFGSVDGTSVSGDNILFTSSGAYDAISYFNGSTFIPLVTENDAVPDGVGTFSRFASQPLRLAGTTVAFEALSIGDDNGIYTSNNGVISLVADKTTQRPGRTDFFTSVDDPQIGPDGSVVFDSDTGGFGGIYTNRTGTLTTVADENDAVPGGDGNFTSLDGAWIQGDDVVFLGDDADGDPGIYASLDGGPIVKLVDSNDAVPDGVGSFTSFNDDSVAYVDGILVFRGEDADNNQGLYFLDVQGGGDITKVVAAGDVLNGLTLDFPQLEKVGFDGRNLAFSGDFNNGSIGAVFVTTIPEPASLALLGLGGLALMRRRCTNT